ncbi:MAG: hypothetical protein RLZZ295_490 [Actinomycetota bacterium]
MSRLLAFGVPFISVFIVTGSVTDPVNMTKLLALGAIGTASVALVVFRGFSLALKTSKVTVFILGLFSLAAIISVLFSELPLSQNIYGVYGRNTGLLTYLFLAGIALGTLTLLSIKSFSLIYKGLFLAGLVNVVYCGWVIFFGDFVSWNNPYGNILGLFGNPNFIGAFLGIWISATVGYVVGAVIPLWKRLIHLPLVLLAMFEVYKSHAVQGVVVTAAGLATVGFFIIRSRTSSWIPVGVYTAGILGFGFTALAGALQKGPLAEYVYKTSVSLRGSYWHAGISNGLNNPFTGVGMDGYGNWYRRSRSEYAATVMPGPRTVSNSAHNVVIDIFSSGGFPLLLSYLLLIALGAIAIIRGLRRSKKYDPVFVALTVAWLGYQLQSFISINQIGLAVWGWLLTGALIAYQAMLEKNNQVSKSSNSNYEIKRTGRFKSEVVSSPLIAGLGAVIGLILASPPMSGDMAWVKSLKTSNFNEVKKVLEPSYLHPRSSDQLVNAITVMENSKLFDQAHEYALIATKYNPASFESWNLLYLIQKSTQEERDLALQNMRRLDPHNPDVTQR